MSKPKSDRAAVTCSKCGHRFVIDIAQFVADNPELQDPKLIPANCPKCNLGTLINIDNPMSTNRPDLRVVR